MALSYSSRKPIKCLVAYNVAPTLTRAGFIITFSALVAAGIAVYESPQFRQWLDNSRRKLAQTLHNLGDEIQPRDSMSPMREDISMTEEVGEAAEERRRVIKEELEQRSASLIERRRKTSDSSPPLSFDSLVDKEGRLLDLDDDNYSASATVANSTAIDLGASQPVQRGKAAADASGSKPQIDMPAFQPKTATPVQLTPTSETPDTGFGSTGVSRPQSRSSDSHTEGNSSASHYYAPPPPEPFFDNDTHQDLRSPFSDLGSAGQASHPERPCTPSTTSDFSHVYESAADASLDGTLSDLGRSEGVATPASWSEVGSVISNDDVNYQNF